MERSERFRLFLKNLMSKAPAGNIKEARAILDWTLNQVEDEYSGIQFEPDLWESDGRMYPPKDDSLQFGSNEELAIYNSRGHRIMFGQNGAIRIEVRRGSCKGLVVLDKVGQDGKFLP